MVRKSATARMEEEFRLSKEEATPAENDEMIEAELNGVSFENVGDFRKWKELQGLNHLLMQNSSQAQHSSATGTRAPTSAVDFGSGQLLPTASSSSAGINRQLMDSSQEENSSTAVTRTPAHVTGFGSGQQPQELRASTAGFRPLFTHKLADATHSRAPLSCSNVPVAAAADPNIGSCQHQATGHTLAGSISVVVQIPTSKTRFFIGKEGRTIKHFQEVWSGVQMDLQSIWEPHTLRVRGDRLMLEQFLLQVGSFLDEDLIRFMPAKPTSERPATRQCSAQIGISQQQQDQLIHRHYTVPSGFAGRLIGSNRRQQLQFERNHSVQMAFFEKGAKCRISARTEEAIRQVISAMNHVIRPAVLSEAPTQQVASSQVQRANKKESTSDANNENMNLPRCNREDFNGVRRGLSEANLGKFFPLPTNMAIPGLTAEEGDLQVTSEIGLLTAAVEIEKLEQKMKRALPLQHTVELLHVRALWKAYLAAFLYVADNNYRQRRPPADSIRVFSFPASWTFAQIHDLLQGYEVVDVVRKRHGVRDYTLSSKGFVTFRNIDEAERADEDGQKWSNAGITVEKIRTEVCAETGRNEPYWRMFDVARLMRLRLIYAILNDEGFSGERWRSRPYRQQREYYKRRHEESIGSSRQQSDSSEAEANAQNGAKLRDSKHLFQIKRALCSYFEPEYFEKSSSEHESYRWPREDVFEHLDRIYAADNSTLEDIERELRNFDRRHNDDMLFQWRNDDARWSENIVPPSGWQWLSIPDHYEVDEMIDTAEALRRWATYLRSLPFDEAIALDIEGSSHGRNGLQLVQLSTFNKACIVDIAKCRNMPEFTELMEAIYHSRALKCDHDGKDFNELSRFLPGSKSYHCVTTPYLIGRFNIPKRKSLGLDGKPRIGHVVAEYLGVMMRKGMACSAWNHRPLTKGQTLYALLDSVAVALLAYRCYDEDKERFLRLAKEDYQRATQRQ